MAEPLEQRRLLSVTGAIFTTDVTGTQVNGNIYADKGDVYLNGGPNGPNGPALPDGDYYVQVTEPDGTLLGSSVNSSGDQTPITVTDGVVTPRVRLLDVLDGSDAGNDPGDYDTSKNPGGEYKVWISKDPIFAPENSKTDNFKVRTSEVEQYEVVGSKFNDLNGDGIRENGEPALAGWIVTLDANDDGTIDATTTTGNNGRYGFLVTTPGQYLVREDLAGTVASDSGTPYAGQFWAQTTINPGVVTIPDDADQDNVAFGGDFGNFQDVVISGHKFYDANANGLDDDGQVVAGIRVTLDKDNDGSVDSTTYTDSDGNYSFHVGLGFYSVKEVLPNGGGTWIQTYGNAGYTIQVGNATNDSSLTTGVASNYGSTPAGTYVVSGGVDSRNNFGDAAVGAGFGHTLGFWSNNNGQKLMTNPVTGALLGPVQDALRGLNLRNANGTFLYTGSNTAPASSDSITYAKFRTWILAATATNMAYMLSAQLAAMKLNVLLLNNGNGSALIYAPALAAYSGALKGNLNSAGFITVGSLITLAVTSLGANGYTVASDATRTYQNVLKDILDAGNNNLNFLLVSPPPVVYTP